VKRNALLCLPLTAEAAAAPDSFCQTRHKHGLAIEGSKSIRVTGFAPLPAPRRLCCILSSAVDMAKKPLKRMKAIRISDEQLKHLAEVGEEMDRPASWLIRRAIDEFIERAKPSKKSR
jgi:hypothetical protein